MKKMKKALSVLCVVALLIGTFSTVAFAATDVDYTITNPYANVDWAWEQYKADLHTHTTASDGDDTLKDMLEINYDYGFDIYAVSDHGLTSYSWTEDQDVIYAVDFFVSLRTPGTEIVVLDEEGLTFDGDTYNVVTENGDDYYYQTYEDGSKGQKMLRVPYANEQNPTSLNNAHVNTWFADYGHGLVGGTSDYETPIKAVDELGGLSVINHPGEYTNARDEKYTADAYDESYEYYITKFENLLLKYPSCIGIDINSKGDGRTRHDRKLWDIMLMDLAPAGRNVSAIATSDAHRTTAAYTGYTRMLMPENTSANLQACMANGEFFAASRCLGNHDELALYADYLIKNGSADAKAAMEDLVARQAEDYEAKYEADYALEAPYVNKVTVDDDADTIALDVSNEWCVRWIANGETIAWGNEIALDDYSDDIGSYVRAEIFGEGGITYTQAFLLDYEGAPEAENKSDAPDLWIFASFFPDTILRFLAELPIFKYLWEMLQ